MASTLEAGDSERTAGEGGSVGTESADSAALAHSTALQSAAANSPALWYLSPGSFANAFRITISTVSGIAGRIVRGMGRGSVMCLSTTANGVSASKGTHPVSIS
jgi:hypothetical protein